jgi:hypothetical protein
MKIFQSNAGGRPIHEEHFSELQATPVSIARGILNGPDGAGFDQEFVVSGCQVSGAGPYAITEGIVKIGNELYKLEAVASVTSAGGKGDLWLQTHTDLSSDQVVYRDGASRYVFVTKRAKITVSNSTPPGGGIRYDATLDRWPNYFDAIGVFLGLNNSYTNLTVSGTGWSSVSQPKVRKISPNLVGLTGAIQQTNTPPQNSGTIMTGIPAGLRPIANRLITVAAYDAATNGIAGVIQITITTSGEPAR